MNKTGTARSQTTRADQTEGARWKAVLERDRLADDRFCYGVRSTGVFCRPTCPSRRPHRRQVVFFDTASDAERAGFRACRRCHPELAKITDPWVDRVRRACVYLANVDGPPSLTTLAARLGGSPYHLQRNFKRLVGVTPREFADACRLRQVKRHLRVTDVTSAMLAAGYQSSSRFYEGAAPRLGMPPSVYRRGGAGMSIRYALLDSPRGRLLVAATLRGVCSIAMGASDTVLERCLREEYPSATIAKDEGALAARARAIVRHLAGKAPRLDLPLDIQATAFEWQVYEALRAIPVGETRTYGEVAAAIGRPRAIRAVARACASNPVAIVIPCHRVVPAGGGPGGYRWGTSRKRALLAAERTVRPRR